MVAKPLSILVIGNGGREHAISWKLNQSPQVENIFITPRNVGAESLSKVYSVALDVTDSQAVAKWAVENQISIVVVGPEVPLAAGISDVLTQHGVQCFGPSKAAARIEYDKSWAKEVMRDLNVPTANWKEFNNAADAQKFIEKDADFEALVIKANGLAAGKGVVVAANRKEASKAASEMFQSNSYGSAAETIIVEEFLEGVEVSVLAFSDGTSLQLMPPSQDHKRAYDGDKGANTGGMGAYCPAPFISDQELTLVENHLQKIITWMRESGFPFVGVLYAGLMMTKDGPKILEFNCRFGDPETQVILPLLETDLAEIMIGCCNGNLKNLDIKWKNDLYTAGVVMASAGYPESSRKGDEIFGLEKLAAVENVVVFHMGTFTTFKDSSIPVTSGGRVLTIMAIDKQLTGAVSKATSLCSQIKFDGAHYRKDIGHKAISRWILDHGNMTYKSSGVDITAGNSLINRLKPAIKATQVDGVLGSIGSFGALFELNAYKLKEPILVSGTDGVGTKLKIALECKRHSTIGIDLVAMCVNDILAHGAFPLFFLDYYATSHLDIDTAQQVIQSIAEGCSIANCALVGGETAEMPGLYSGADYDIAGFTVGVVEKSNMLPKSNIAEGDCIIALASSGLHSNGFSLVRRIMESNSLKYSDRAPFSQNNLSYGEEFLVPTSIYVRQLKPCLEKGQIKAFAHITGGGLVENIPRILPDSCKAVLDSFKWKILPVYGWIASVGNVSEAELLRTFNCGVGGILVVDKSLANEVAKIVGGTIVGSIEKKVGSPGEKAVEVKHFSTALMPLMLPHLKEKLNSQISQKKPKIAVLISGSGTNLQSLIDATVNGSVPAEIVLVISNIEKAYGLTRAKEAGINTRVIKHKDYSSRQLFDNAMHEVLIKAEVDLVCLAGFMRILTSDFVTQWRGKLINIHPALLPSFKGTHAQRQAIEAGVTVAGCTVHFVEAEIDNGAIIAQETVSVSPDETEETLIEKIKGVEHIAYPKALKLLVTGKVSLDLNSGKLVRK